MYNKYNEKDRYYKNILEELNIVERKTKTNTKDKEYKSILDNLHIKERKL